ncbi:protein HEAT-STRESS-ASSOCIATED 32 isoform X1 [Ananas comosus]|uniref:Protein HEAT-STRESS-ASSOCIATED 32 isoform X1 n=1 Tax=Ananas comosus TaxID=4615 RepID=A0A6P5GE42_ANACO|nr:protein HEAT-STRESS-ASSOCIATED 32 isoform X1 [Ananas comosus]
MGSYYAWKSFNEDEDRPEKPRRYGLTEMRSPFYSFLGHDALQETLETMGEFVDGLKFAGGSHSLMPKAFIKEITDLAHRHDVYVSTGDWAEHLLRKGPSSFKQYVEVRRNLFWIISLGLLFIDLRQFIFIQMVRFQECKNLGFDTIELNASSLKLPEEALLRFVRLIKRSGLKVKPQFAVKFDRSEIPAIGDRAFGAYIAPGQQISEIVEDVDLLIRRAERCLEAGADMIMIDADDVCKYTDDLRTDIIAKIISRLGVEKTMFEAPNSKTSEWFIKRYGPKVNLFVDHSEVMNLECLRGRNSGQNHASVLGSSFFLV